MTIPESILSIGLSPALQKTILFEELETGEVNRAEKYYLDAAGKSINLARVLVQSGMKTACITPAGEENRKELEQLCHRDGITLYPVETAGRVRYCYTLLSRKDGTATELVVNEAEPVSMENEAQLLGLAVRRIQQRPKAVVVAGSRLPGFSNRIIPVLVEECSRDGVPFIADYRGEDLRNSFIDEYIRPDLVKINAGEFHQSYPEYPNLEEGLKDVSHRYGNRFVISRGAESILAAEKGQLFEIPTEQVRAVNPIGCGDSMTAGLARGMVEGLSLKESLLLGRDYATRNALSIHPGWIKKEI